MLQVGISELRVRSVVVNKQGTRVLVLTGLPGHLAKLHNVSIPRLTGSPSKSAPYSALQTGLPLHIRIISLGNLYCMLEYRMGLSVWGVGNLTPGTNLFSVAPLLVPVTVFCRECFPDDSVQRQPRARLVNSG